ncbi:MAG: GAF domain-containing protein [Deltaproteobacteria bacterium]|nr:GAF domain-containing protein [Deltaproteobacteria bacterium]
MPNDLKNIAIIGANKEGLKLLPILLNDGKSRICMIADTNRDAMLFKLNELGYRLAKNLDIKIIHDLNEIKKQQGLDIIINALQDQATEKFLESPEFRDIEKLGPLSTRLIWGVRASAPKEGAVDKGHEQFTLLSSFREIVDAVRLTIDRKELLSVILKLATEYTHAERGSIMLLSAEEGTLRVEIAKGMDEEVIRKIRVPLGDGISGKVAKEGKPMLISGKAKGDEFTRPMDRSDVKNSMCVPLLVNGEVIGVINVSSSESAHVFTNDDLNFLTSLASLAAEVIQRSNEYERLRVDAAKFTFWKEVDTVMSSASPLDKRLNVVARRLSEIVPGLTCFIYIYDDDRNRLFLQASSIKDAKGLGLLSLRAGEGMEGATMDSMDDVFLVDRTEHGATKRVYLTLPMVSNNTLVGTLNGHVVSSHGLSVYHESFLKDIRTLIAESVYKQNKHEKEKLRSRKMFAVDEAGLEMISIKDPKRLVTIISTTPAAILGAEGSLLRIQQAGSKRFQTVSTYGLDDKKIREYFLPIEKETVMEVLRKKTAVVREFSEEASPYIRSVLSLPLRVENNIIAVLTLFNKSNEATVYPCAFSRADADTFTRFAVYAEKALANVIMLNSRAEQKPERKLETGQTPLHLFEQRVEQELNRARRMDKSLVLATVRIAGLKDAFRNRKAEFETKLIGYIRKRTRNFDVVVRLNEETFGFLFLDTNEKISRLLGSITEVIANDEDFRKAFGEGKADILYGYASFPNEGDSFAELFSKASSRVKLDLNKNFGAELSN